jgi:hypothetical protein
MLIVGRQHDPRLRSNPLILGDAKLEEFSDDRGEATHTRCQECTRPTVRKDSLLEEHSFVSGVGLDVLLERLVLYERVVRPERVGASP